MSYNYKADHLERKLLNGLPKVFTEVAIATWTTILLKRNKYKEGL